MKTLKWPHSSKFKADPESLAEAGFFYDPSYDDPDNVTCFRCGKQLGGWEEEDDPYLIHWEKCGQTCCWAVVQCGLTVDMDKSGMCVYLTSVCDNQRLTFVLRFMFPDKTRLPNHKSMEKARLETFTIGKGWVHDNTKNHGASSKSVRLLKSSFLCRSHVKDKRFRWPVQVSFTLPRRGAMILLPAFTATFL